MKPFFIVSFLFSLSAFAASPVFHYKPSSVELAGSLEFQTFPGPPNYESIASGDQTERGPYLKLDQPMDVVARKGDSIDNPVTEKNVKVIQLAINAEDDALWSKFRSAGQGARIQVKGSLFHQFTGHHHARILLDVQSMELLSKTESGSANKR
jgi:hypothetical protein